MRQWFYRNHLRYNLTGNLLLKVLLPYKCATQRKLKKLMKLGTKNYIASIQCCNQPGIKKEERKLLFNL